MLNKLHKKANQLLFTQTNFVSIFVFRLIALKSVVQLTVRKQILPLSHESEDFLSVKWKVLSKCERKSLEKHVESVCRKVFINETQQVAWKMRNSLNKIAKIREKSVRGNARYSVSNQPWSQQHYRPDLNLGSIKVPVEHVKRKKIVTSNNNSKKTC